MTEARFTESLGVWARRERVELGVTQLQLANALQVSRELVSNWERGRSVMSAYQHSRIRAYFRTRRARVAGKAAQ